MRRILVITIWLSPFLLLAQGYWQQRVAYKMDIDFNVDTHRFDGEQTLTYFNNSPDTLYNVYYHLYFNAFQPNSMMDVRSRNLPDPDRRVRDRIFYLDESEIGYHQIKKLTQDGSELSYEIENTVLEVTLDQPIPPNTSSVFKMSFQSQVPKQIRRSGRNNAEGISYSMSQWFPKMAEYDKNGWHAHPYVAREFYAPWGDYEVNITIDRSFVVAASAVLQNPEKIGYGYIDENKVKRSSGKKLTWKFKAENVHDFMWAADPDYTHTQMQVPDGPVLHFFYQSDTLVENWERLPLVTVKAFQYISENFGQYPYPVFNVIQGGDGGMEYPMSTLITGHRSLMSLIGVTIHEALHSWYQGVLATNESYYAWMDEGFTSYASSQTVEHLFGSFSSRPAAGSFRGYFEIVDSGSEEPLTTHSDHYSSNLAYGRGAYSKGSVALVQMGYVLGDQVMRSGLLKYFDTWKFKHPDKNDFIRVMEKHSGIELDWYFDFWISTTKKIDYGVLEVVDRGSSTQIELARIGEMPMPIDLVVTYLDGSQKLYYIPLGVMRGEKKNETGMERVILNDWYWTHPSYQVTLPVSASDIKKIEIDPSNRLADVNQKNNIFEASFTDQPENNDGN